MELGARIDIVKYRGHVPEVSLTSPSQMLVRQEALRPRCLVEERTWKSIVGLRLTCVRVRHFSPPEAGGIGVEVVCAVYAKVLRIRATGDYVEDAESVRVCCKKRCISHAPLRRTPKEARARTPKHQYASPP